MEGIKEWKRPDSCREGAPKKAAERWLVMGPLNREPAAAIVCTCHGVLAHIKSSTNAHISQEVALSLAYESKIPLAWWNALRPHRLVLHKTVYLKNIYICICICVWTVRESLSYPFFNRLKKKPVLNHLFQFWCQLKTICFKDGASVL